MTTKDRLAEIRGELLGLAFAQDLVSSLNFEGNALAYLNRDLSVRVIALEEKLKRLTRSKVYVAGVPK